MTVNWKHTLRLATLGVLVVASAGFVVFSMKSDATAQQPAGSPQAEDRAADRTAVREAVAGFARVFGTGDAKALAALWTAEGEYHGDDGVTVTGRAALAKEYAAHFAANPGTTLELEIDAVRFPSRDNAVVEGYAAVRRKSERDVSRFTLLLAREDGKWLITILREQPGDGASLRDLDWLVGEWSASRDGVEVRSTYEWSEGKAFLQCKFSITQNGKTQSGNQTFAKDPSTGLLRSWTFESGGGIGEATVTRDGKKWVQEARGVLPDGRVLTATNVMTQLDADTFLWHPAERTLDDEALPALVPIKVTRVKKK